MPNPFVEFFDSGSLIEVVDIGANPIDGPPPYLPLIEQGLCRLTGFDPQEGVLDPLAEREGATERYLPYAVGDGERHVLHQCKASGMTSLLEPDPERLELFELMKISAEITGKQEVQTRRLDEIEEIERIDFLKIDIQGSELSVFCNGREQLADAVVVQTEMSLFPLYRNQPGFGELDQELRAQGFMPHHFAQIKRCAIAPLRKENDIRKALNQLLETDMVYVRDISRPNALSDAQLRRLATIAHYCYRSYDLAAWCCKQLELRGSVPEATRRYVSALATRSSKAEAQAAG